ncbi:hypothetical protein HD554DRAFT_2038324 [Boletus coccyginus]|nr:hypothetical protein HD554DRAFT_2038324 [Boletus coccyginus]
MDQEVQESRRVGCHTDLPWLWGTEREPDIVHNLRGGTTSSAPLSTLFVRGSGGPQDVSYLEVHDGLGEDQLEDVLVNLEHRGQAEASDGKFSQGLEGGDHHALEGAVLDEGAFEDSIDEEGDGLATKRWGRERGGIGKQGIVSSTTSGSGSSGGLSVFKRYLSPRPGQSFLKGTQLFGDGIGDKGLDVLNIDLVGGLLEVGEILFPQDSMTEDSQQTWNGSGSRSGSGSEWEWEWEWKWEWEWEWEWEDRAWAYFGVEWLRMQDVATYLEDDLGIYGPAGSLGWGLFEPEGLSLTITLDSICIALVRETINAVLLTAVELMVGLSDDGCDSRHGGGEETEIDVMEAGLIMGVVGDGIVDLGMDAMDCGSSVMDMVSKEDVIDVVEDLAEGMDNGIGLYVAVALCEDGDGMTIDVAMKVDRDSGRIIGKSIIEGGELGHSPWSRWADSDHSGLLPRRRYSCNPVVLEVNEVVIEVMDVVKDEMEDPVMFLESATVGRGRKCERERGGEEGRRGGEGRDSQEIGGADDVLEVHAMEDVSEEEDDHVCMLGGESGGVVEGVEKSVPSVIDDDGGGGKDCVKTNVSAEAKNVVNVVAMEGGDDAVIVDAKEEVVIDMNMSPVLEEMEYMEVLMSSVKGLEYGEGDGGDGHCKEVGFKVEEELVVLICVDGAHDGIIEEALRLSIV